MHYIYKFTNRKTGKHYIGQTNNLQKRYNGHKSESYNKNSKGYWLPFHCAIRRYGIDNFSFEVLEEIADGESQSFIDEREKYFIKKYNSLTSANGYNITIGGQGVIKPKLTYKEKIKRSKLFTNVEIKDIQNRLMHDEEFDEIEQIYSPRLKRTFLININTGNNFYNPNFNYPLKKNSKSKFSQKEIKEIKTMIKKGCLYKDIQKKFNIKSAGFISGINNGKYYYDKNETYPLFDKQGQKAQNEKWIEEIRKEIMNTSTPLTQIAQKFNKSYATVKNINSGRSHKKEGLTYPLRRKQ